MYVYMSAAGHHDCHFSQSCKIVLSIDWCCWLNWGARGGGRGGGILSSSVSIRLNLLLNFDCFFGIQHLILFTFFIKGISIHPFYRRAGPPLLKNSCARQWLAMPLFGFRLIIDHFVLLTL